MSFLAVVVRLAAIIAIQPLWRRAFGPALGVLMAVLLAVAFAGTQLETGLALEQGVAFADVGAVDAVWRARTEPLGWRLVAELLVGLAMGLAVAIPCHGLIGGVDWVGRRLGVGGEGGAQAWARMHLLLAGWIFFKVGMVEPALVRGGSLLGVDGRFRLDAVLSQSPGQWLTSLAHLAGAALEISVAIAAPVLIAGLVMVSAVELTAGSHPSVRQDVWGGVRALGAVAMLLAWTASWHIDPLPRGAAMLDVSGDPSAAP